MDLKPLKVAPPWEACLLPLSGFPMPVEEVERVRGLLQGFSRAAAARWKLAAEVFILVPQLVNGDAGSRLSKHGREWIPALGLGVWPDRGPPTVWTKEDFENLGFGDMPRTLMYQVFRVTTGPEARENARNVMLGAGTVIQMMTSAGSEALLQAGREVLLPPIQDPAFTSFPFYMPLLEGKSFAGAKAEQLDRWLCGATVYVRESAEDQAILIASREPLRPVLESLGGRLLPS